MACEEIAVECGDEPEVKEEVKDPCGPCNEAEAQEQFVREFLRGKNIPDEHVQQVFERGLTEEIIEYLQCEGLTYEDIITVGKAFKKESSSTNVCNCTFQSESEISSRKDYLESAYLRENFGQILPIALREIITKKPVNPIEYLGHWLLYYRECEERENRRKEFEEELLEERAKFIVRTVEREPSDMGEEEEHFEHGEFKEEFY